MTDLAHLQRRILEVLPSRPPGLRQAAIRDKLGGRLKELGETLPHKEEVNQAIQLLLTKRLLESHRIQPPGEEFPYRVYWRDASYVPPLEASHG